MANTIKRGLSYFPLDIDIFDDLKILQLYDKYKGDGVVVYEYVLCKVYKEGYYLKYDNTFSYFSSRHFQMPREKFHEIVEYCVSLELFDKHFFDRGIITSAAIQRRYEKACRDSKRKDVLNEYKCISSEEYIEKHIPNSEINNISSEEIQINSEELYNNSEEKEQRKEKKNKINKKIDTKVSPKKERIIDNVEYRSKPLEERKNMLKERMGEYLKKKFGDNPSNDIKNTFNDFFKFWTQLDYLTQSVMKFEFCESFEIPYRLATWKKKEVEYNK